MTKYEEALATLKEYCDGFFLQGSLKIIEELVELSTPKEPIKIIYNPPRYDIKEEWLCPTCNESEVSDMVLTAYDDYEEERHAFCHNCRQVINWK